MQKISLTNRLRQIRRIRVLTVLACVILLFFVGQIIISKNPRSSKAAAPSPPAGASCLASTDADGKYTCTINSSITLPDAGTANSLDETNLIIGTGVGTAITVTSSGHHDFNNLTIRKATVSSTDSIDWTITNSLIQFPASNILADGTAGSNSGNSITINAKKIMRSGNNVLISASAYNSSGNGNGGTINITADSYSNEYSGASATMTPWVDGGATGQRGMTNISNPYLAGINALGHGSGTGGMAIINIKNIRGICYITSGTSINQNCENSDVLIDGDTDNDGVVEGLTINADTVQVWQPLPTGVTPPSGYSLGGDCAGQSIQQYCDSKRRFASLMIINGAKLTHQAVTVADMAQDTVANGGMVNNSLADNTKGTARWKKVDLVVDEDIVLDSGGNINADGAGYPSATTAPGADIASFTSDSAYGPGRGIGYYISDGSHSIVPISAGGGSYGGIGGIRWWMPCSNQLNCSTSNYGVVSPLPVSYPASYSPVLTSGNFEWGSGGGWAASVQAGINSYSKGGDGGGRIYIKVKNIYINDSNSKITADGTAGSSLNVSPNRISLGGGGSGGTIWLEIDNAKFSNIQGPFIMNSDQGVGGDCLMTSGDPSVCSWAGKVGFFTGQAGTINFVSPTSFGNNAFYNISSKGGNAGVSGYIGTGNGGGGRIIIKKLDYYPDATVKKTLTPILRDSSKTACNPASPDPANPNCTFNPYSLQKGDKIGVSLTVEGVPSGDKYTLTDDWLSTGSITVCKPLRTSLILPSGASSNCGPSGTYCAVNPLIWSNLTWTNTTNTITYQCEVQ